MASDMLAVQAAEGKGTLGIVFAQKGLRQLLAKPPGLAIIG